MLHSRYVILVVLYWTLSTNGAVVRNEDICGAQNGRRLYLELGEQGILYAKNVSFIKNAPRLQASRIYTTNNSHEQCSLELVTCPSCVINLTFKSIGLSQHCGDSDIMLDSPCRCDYVWLSEPPYEDVSGTPFCGLYSPISYRSNTRTLSITLLYSQTHNHAFNLEYTAERNKLHLKGTDLSSGIGKSRNNTSGSILTSPFFPARYPRDLGMEYIITCPAEASSCRVRILFSDFQLAAVSIMEFYDFNGQRLDVSSGARFRPPVIVSSGPSLLIRFYANGGTGLGYKAFYSFVLGHLYDKSVQPITDCGGYVENLGGAITMMDMVDQGVKIYDCVWLIRPPTTFLHMKTHMYLKIITFDDMAGNTELVIKEGPTSALLPLETLRHPASKLQPRRIKEHVAPVSIGFHVSLRGTFGPSSHLAMAYAAFSYTDCFTGSDFLCQNHRCIPSQLNCDGFDHCGDNSDEPATCFQDWDLEPQDRKWHTNKANYYFPKIDRYPDLKTATLVFVASSLGLITLISALIVLLYRMGARASQQRELQSRLQTISELLDAAAFDLPDGARLDEVNVSDDPPGYESPPGYDEVVKLGLESERGKNKKKKSNSNDRKSRSSNSQSPVDCEAQTSVSLSFDGGASTSHCYQSVPVTDTNVQPAVPKSPPPPYITPPETMSRNMNLLGLSRPPESAADNFSDHGDRTRRCWFQSSETYSRSEPASEAPTPGCLTSSIVAESLGAYLRHNAVNSSECPTPQLSSWEDASTNINPEFVERSRDVEDVVDVRDNKRDHKACSCQGACRCVIDDLRDSSSPIAVQETAVDQNKTPSSKKEKEPVISSASAVASLVFSAGASSSVVATSLSASSVVATSSSASSVVATSSSFSSPVATSSSFASAMAIFSSLSSAVATSSASSAVANSSVTACSLAATSSTALLSANTSSTASPAAASLVVASSASSSTINSKNVLIKLFGNSKLGTKSPRSMSFNSSNFSTASSSPCSTFGKSFMRNGLSRKLSICSHDSYVTRISALSASSSCEKLQDDFDIVSEPTSILGSTTRMNTPANTPKIGKGRIMSLSRPSTGRYLNCDLESLYEGIRIFDSFLARHGMNINYSRNSSMTVMLFGTPKHTQKRVRKAYGYKNEVERKRIWRSTDDTSILEIFQTKE